MLNIVISFAIGIAVMMFAFGWWNRQIALREGTDKE